MTIGSRTLGQTDLNLLEALFAQLSDCPFFIKDDQLRYAAANRAMARLCGVARPSDLYGARASDFFPAELAQHYEVLDRRVIVTGKPLTNWLELSTAVGANGSWLLFSRVPVRAADGAVVGVGASARTLLPSHRQGGQFERLAQVAQRLRDKPELPLRLSELTNIAGLSSSQLERDFLRIFGVPPRTFLQQARIERATQLLATQLSVAAIAYECGFADHSAFTRSFRRVVGMSPSAYRRRI